MEHIIKFKVNSWGIAIEKITNYMQEGYFLDNIQTTRSFIYGDGDLSNVIQTYEIEMIKYEKESE